MIYLTNEIINIKIRLIKSCKKINSSIIGELAFWKLNWPQFIITSIYFKHVFMWVLQIAGRWLTIAYYKVNKKYYWNNKTNSCK